MTMRDKVRLGGMEVDARTAIGSNSNRVLPKWPIWSLLILPLALSGAGEISSQPQISRSIPPRKSRDSLLEEAIRREAGNGAFSYAYNWMSLSGGKAPEALVYMPGPDYCGSGGCTSFVFAKREGAYRLVSSIPLTRPPIVVSSHRTNGWKDLIVFVAGGGIQPGFYAVLPFDGKKYPENPSAAAPLRHSVKGVAYLVGADQAQSHLVVSP